MLEFSFLKVNKLLTLYFYNTLRIVWDNVISKKIREKVETNDSSYMLIKLKQKLFFKKSIFFVSLRNLINRIKMLKTFW